MALADVMLRIGGDAKGAVAALRDVADGTRELTDREKKRALVLGAVIGATAVAVKMTIDFGDQLNKEAQQLGVTTEALSGLSHAAKLSGLEHDQLKDGMKDLGKIMHDSMRDPASETAELFKMLGVQLTDSQGDLRATDDVLGQLADVFQHLPDGADKSAVAMKLMGESGMRLIPMLNEGSAGIDRMKSEAEALGVVWSEDTSQAAADFNTEIGILKASIAGFVQQTTQLWLPTLVKAAEWINETNRLISGEAEIEAGREFNRRAAKDRIDAQAEVLASAKKNYQSNLDLYEAMHEGKEYVESEYHATLRARVEKEQGFYDRLYAELAEDAGLQTAEAKAALEEIQAIADKGKLFGWQGERKEGDEAAASEESSASAAEAAAQAQADADAAALQVLRDSLRTEQEILTEDYEAQLDLINRLVGDEQQAADTKQAILLNYLSAIRAIEAEDDSIRAERRTAYDLHLETLHLKNVERIKEEARQKRELTRTIIESGIAESEAWLSISSIITDSVVAMYKEGSQEAKDAQRAAFVVSKGVGLANAIVSLAVAIAKANENPYPQNIPAIIAAAATGGAAIATIAATTVAGLADAGLTPDQLQRVAGRGHSAIMVRGDEMVLDPVGTRHITEMLALQRAGMGGGERPQQVNTTVTLDGQIVGQSVETYMVKELEQGRDFRQRTRAGALFPGSSS